jgi:phosphoribosyl-ATP pyrophosphohydrolase
MTDTVKHPSLKIFKLQRRASRRDRVPRKSTGPRHAGAAREPASVSPLQKTGSPAVPDPCTGIETQSIQPSELDRLHRSLSGVTPKNHPRTARLLASSTRKIAQKVIEEAGEVALEAVKHHDRGIVRESADLLYHLVALWHRAGINPDDVWTEMRGRADTLGIAEKLPKARRDHRNPPPARTEQE